MKKGILTELLDSMKIEEEAPRNYIGASSVGESCERKLWYRFNQKLCEPFNAKQRRTLDIGKSLELLIINCLRNSGINVIRTYDDFKTFEFFDKEFPYFRGNIDALIENADKSFTLLEIKTAKDASFNLFKKNGLQQWNPNYFAQVQSYMGLSGYKEAVVLALNKDTSEFHDEWVAFDSDYFYKLRMKAKKIFESKEPLKRINESSLYYACRMCGYRKICRESN